MSLQEIGLKPLRWGGHCYLCSKTMQGDPIGEDEWRRQLGGIELPQNFADRTLTVEVLAIGPAVGRPCTKVHMRQFQRAKYLDLDVSVGDMLLCPNRSPVGDGIGRFLGVKHWYLIEESIPIAIWKVGSQDK